jgi:hypothetical protein
MSTDPSGKFPSGYILAGREQKRIGQKELDALYVVEVRTYVERVAVVSQQWDTTTEGILETSTALYYRGESYTGLVGPDVIENQALDSAEWGLTTLGVLTECQQLSDNWWQVTSKDVVPQDLGSPVSNKGYLIRTWITEEPYTWPDVIDGVNIFAIPRKNGSTASGVGHQPLTQGGTYPTPTRRAQYWNATPQATLSTTEIMRTSSFRYSGAQVSFSASGFVGDGFDIDDDVGSADPVFDSGNYGITVAASPVAIQDWFTTYTQVSVTQEPFRGGYLVTTIEIKKPF